MPQGADGFVMGEGAAIFLLKRLADAERDQDKIYAVLRGIGGASDGKGKGITAPNPVGQKLCVERAWKNAGLSPGTATLIEGHGTSTRVGDVVEAQSMVEVLGQTSLPVHSVALGSVKSNIGHLKGAAGAAGMLKAHLSLHHKVLPPSLHCEHPSPDIDFAHSPLYVNTELKPWEVPADAHATRGRQRVRFRRHQLPHGDGRAHSRQAERQRQEVDRGSGELPPATQPVPMQCCSRRDVPPCISRAKPDRAKPPSAWSAGDWRSPHASRNCIERLRAVQKIGASWAGARRSLRRPRRICMRRSVWRSTTPTPPNWRTSAAWR